MTLPTLPTLPTPRLISDLVIQSLPDLERAPQRIDPKRVPSAAPLEQAVALTEPTGLSSKIEIECSAILVDFEFPGEAGSPCYPLHLRRTSYSRTIRPQLGKSLHGFCCAKGLTSGTK